MPDPGVPLSSYLPHAGDFAVRFACGRCERSFDVDLAKVLARLERRGLGGPHTGIREVGWLAQRPCRRCGGKRWRTTPTWVGGRR